MKRLDYLRNIGISAHIDSGKTTLTERMLYYTGRIHRIAEVRGKDGVGATMDSMELEKERGITIQSAATFCEWKLGEEDHFINIIDTPGHVDFTIEVERALSVLDGAILVLCSVGGVQSQSMTVDRQMRRYNVPRVAFINKMDRQGGDAFGVTKQLREKLHHNAVMVQIPMGSGYDFEGVIDLVEMKAIYNNGDRGEIVEVKDIPEQFQDAAEEARSNMVEQLADFDEDLAEKFLEAPETIENADLYTLIRKCTLSREITPVFCGSAYRNKGVQALLDGVCRYLPNPKEVTNKAFVQKDGKENQFILETDDSKPLCALAFKLDDTAYGQLTYTRVYQGVLKKGETIYNSRTGKKHKVGRLMRLHADQMDEIEEAGAGQIVALFGIDCASGDTFHGADQKFSMRTMHVPEPVISRSIVVTDKKVEANLSKALSRFTKEDPTFRVERDEETLETVISGMGELHLEVYIERIKREYKCPVQEGQPRVRYRESITEPTRFVYTHKKQTGGSGQFAKLEGIIEPLEEGEFEFEDKITGGAIPKEYLKACEAGFREAMKEGSLIGAPIVGVKITIDDGATHAVDSSEMAFKTAARMALRENYNKCKPKVLEPVMTVQVEVPEQFQGRILGDLTRRRGRVTGTSMTPEQVTVIDADVPLNEMFSYSSNIRSATEGKGEFTMEFGRYEKAPVSVQEELVEDHQRKLEEKKKK